MPRPLRTTIIYDADGELVAINHRVMQLGTADFGDGPEEATKESGDSMARNLISPATVTAVKQLIDAFEVDISAERKRVAEFKQAEADRAAADAAAAALLAAE